MKQLVVHTFEKAASALCYSFIRARYGKRAGDPGPTWNRTVRFVLDQHSRMPDYLRWPLMALTVLFNLSTCVSYLRPFHRLDPVRRWTRIERARGSIFPPFQDLLRFFDGLTVFRFRDELPDANDGKVAATLAIGNVARVKGHHDRATELPQAMRSELAVIGSGPGGSIVACLAAEAGCEVTLIESGSFLPFGSSQQFSSAEMESKYRNGGITTTLGRTKISYVESQCVGGGSEINAGLYHRTPDDVLEAWRRDYRLVGAALADMVPHFEDCERDVSISYMLGQPPLASLKLQKGAEIKGWRSLEIPRWFKYESTDQGIIGIKQSMTRTYIPRALRAGCKLIPNLHARRLTRAGSMWVVHLEHTLPGMKPTWHEVHCESLFVCGGAIQTPALLLASGINQNVGRSLRMSPTIKVVASFPEEVNFRGMGVPVHQVREFSPRVNIGCSISNPPYLSLAMLDHAEDLKKAYDGWPTMAAYYAAVSGGVGEVRKLPLFRDPLVTYRLTNADMRDLADGLRKLCEILFAAGAETLYPSVAGLAPLRNPEDLSRIPDRLPDAGTNLMAVHLFSSCPMGEDHSRCVTDFFGKVRGHEGLYIADASLLCTAPGVNPQGSVMAFARRNVMHFLGQTGRSGG